MTALKTAIENWNREGIKLHPPIEEQVITTVLEKVGRPYSRDIITLYSATGGMQSEESDSHLRELWSIERLLSKNLKYNRREILFADFCINSHLYCFRYVSDQTSSVCIDYFNGEEPEHIADSVREFFEIYVTDPEKLRMFG